MKHRLPVVLICLLLVWSLPVAAQDDDTVISPELVEQIEGIESATIALRGLDELEPVIRIFPTPAEVIDFIAADLESQLDPQTSQRELQFYLAFDFFDEELDLLDTMTTLLGEQVAGFYNPETDEMNVLLTSGEPLGDSLPFLERVTYAHEYIHALQDQHFDLFTYLDEIQDTDNADLTLARLALVEGDATLVMQEYTIQAMTEDPMAAMEMLNSDVVAAAGSFGGVPFILQEELTWPYFAGMEFVVALRENGGWDAVNAAFDSPPQSTEQIIHPERYLSGDAPIDVTLAEDSAALLDGDDWQLLYERVFGEFYMRQYLGTQLARGVLNRAATGWGGDRYQLYYNNNNNERAWVMRLVMDTPTDADEMAETFTQFAGLRMFGAEATVSAAGADCWTNDIAETLCVLLESDDTLLLSFAPTAMDADALIAAQR